MKIRWNLAIDIFYDGQVLAFLSPRWTEEKNAIVGEGVGWPHPLQLFLTMVTTDYTIRELKKNSPPGVKKRQLGNLQKKVHRDFITA